jgi:hypothetical protein
MSTPDRPRRPGILAWFKRVLAVFAIATAGVLAYQIHLLKLSWDLSLRDTSPMIRPVGPTQVQLERLRYLVTSRVHVADVLVGESRWLEGSWIIQGDALLGVDTSRAEINDRDEAHQMAVIVLPQPSVLSARVNHERTQQWDIKSRSWIPLASLLLGDRQSMEKQAMAQAQQLMERAASSEEHLATARKGVEGMLGEFYRGVGWTITVQWK